MFAEEITRMEEAGLLQIKTKLRLVTSGRRSICGLTRQSRLLQSLIFTNNRLDFPEGLLIVLGHKYSLWAGLQSSSMNEQMELRRKLWKYLRFLTFPLCIWKIKTAWLFLIYSCKMIDSELSTVLSLWSAPLLKLFCHIKIIMYWPTETWYYSPRAMAFTEHIEVSHSNLCSVFFLYPNRMPWLCDECQEWAQWVL